MSYGKVFKGRKGWCIRVWLDGSYLEHTWTNEAAGPIIGDIVLEHNSVGACISGELTFNGFWDWKPRSRLIEIFYGPEPIFENRLGMAISGILRGQKTPDGIYSSQVPLLGLHTRDENGLASLGLSAIGDFVDNQMYVLGSYKGQTSLPDRFGLTVDGAVKELFGDRVDSAWGVRPDGMRIAAYPGASGGVARWDTEREGWKRDHIRLESLTFDTATEDGVAYVDSGYEEPSFTTEAQWRLTERHHVNTYTRYDLPALAPRRGSSENQGLGELVAAQRTIGGDSGEAAEEQPVEAAPETPAEGAEAGEAAAKGNAGGGFTRGIDLPKLVLDSLSNPNKFDPMYELAGVEITIEVTANLKKTTDKYKGEKGVIKREGHPAVEVEWAEWLGKDAGAITAAAADFEPELHNLDVTPRIEIQDASVVSSVSGGKDYVYSSSTTVVGKVQSNPDYKSHPYKIIDVEFNKKRKTLDLKDAYQVIYHHYGTLTPERPKLAWRFSAPAALLRMVEGAVPKVEYKETVPVYEEVGGKKIPVMVEDPETGEKKQATKEVPRQTAEYQWCVGLAYTPHRVNDSATMTVTAATIYEKRVQEKPMPDFPGLELPYCSPPTFNGQLYGVLAYGPITLTNLKSANGRSYDQPITNSRMVIAKENIRTEFQTAAVQRGSNGTARNMTNVQNFAWRAQKEAGK